MPGLEFFLVCRSVQADIVTNEISLVNVLEDITPEAFPYILQRAMAVSLWNFQESESKDGHEATLHVKIPGREDVVFPMKLSSDAHRGRAVQGILEIPIESPCDMVFEVQLNGRHAASHTVKIHPVEVGEGLSEGEPMPVKPPKRVRKSPRSK